MNNNSTNLKEDDISLILDNNKISSIQANIESINKTLDNNKFISNDELSTKLQLFTDQVKQLSLQKPNININYYDLFKQDYPNESRWDMPSSITNMLPIAQEQIDIKKYLIEFNKIIKEMREESERQIKEFELKNTKMEEALNSNKIDNSDYELIEKVVTIKDAIDIIVDKNKIFTRLLEFNLRAEINDNLFVDPECIFVDLIQLTKNQYIYLDDEKDLKKIGKSINEYLITSNEITDPSLERDTGLNLYELLINPNFDNLLKPVNLSILSNPQIRDSKVTIFPLFKRSLKELATSIHRNTNDLYTDIKNQVYEKENLIKEELIQELIQEEIKLLEEKIKTLSDNIKETIEKTKNNKDLIDIIINSRNPQYIRVFSNFINNNNNIFNTYDILINILGDIKINKTKQELTLATEKYNTILNKYLEINLLLNKYEESYENFQKLFTTSSYFNTLKDLEIFKDIDINELIGIDCSNLNIESLKRIKLDILKIINDVRLNIINNNETYFKDPKFTQISNQIKDVKECKRKIEERKKIIELYKTAKEKYDQFYRFVFSNKISQYFTNELLTTIKIDKQSINCSINDSQINEIPLNHLIECTKKLNKFDVNKIKDILIKKRDEYIANIIEATKNYKNTLSSSDRNIIIALRTALDEYTDEQKITSIKNKKDTYEKKKNIYENFKF